MGAAEAEFEARLETRGDTPTVVVRGEIDVSTAELFEKHMMQAANLGGTVAVDMAQVGFMDSTGLSVIVRTVDVLRTHGAHQLQVLAPRDAVRKTLVISGLDRLVDIVD